MVEASYFSTSMSSTVGMVFTWLLEERQVDDEEMKTAEKDFFSRNKVWDGARRLRGKGKRESLLGRR